MTHLPLIKTLGANGLNYGDAAAFIASGTGLAKGGKVLYGWSTLLSGPQGQAIMADAVSWILDATLRPPQPRLNSIQAPDNLHAVFNFDARSNLDYIAQFRNNLNVGAWLLLRDFSSAPTNRPIWFTNNVSGMDLRFYRLIVGP